MNRKRTGKTKRQRRIAANASELFGIHGCDLLIDGYNLMHATRFKPRKQHPGELHARRTEFLKLLNAKLVPPWFSQVTVVFDAHAAPKHLPEHQQWQHLSVRFARDENTADDLIISLLQNQATSPRLVVVTSDHRVQIIARRRGVAFVDSDEWFDELLAWSTSSGPPDDAAVPSPKEPSDGTKPNPDTIDHPFPSHVFDELKAEFPHEP